MEETVPVVEDVQETLLQLLKQPTIASKKWVYEQFDTHAQSNTVVGPGSNAAVIRWKALKRFSALRTAISLSVFDPEMAAKSPLQKQPQCGLLRRNSLAVTDGLNFGSPDKTEIFWQLEKAVDGISAACLALGTPVIGGNVSLYNETKGETIYPTPIIGMVGLVEDLEHVTTQNFKNSGDLIYLLGQTKEEFGGSELQKLTTGKIFGKAPQLDLNVERKHQQQVLQAIQKGLVASAHDVAEGGLGVAVAECLMDSPNLGAEITVRGNLISALFSESQSRFILSVKEEHKRSLNVSLMPNSLERLLRSRFSRFLEEDIISEVDKLRKAWKGAIP